MKQTFVPFLAVFVTLLPYLSVAYEIKVIDKPGILDELNLHTVVGPESIAFDPAGHGPYTGVSNGRILKWQGRGLGWSDFAYNAMHSDRDCVENTDEMMESKCGRPLGLRFHNATGSLYIADAYRGLLSVGPKGGLVKVLASKARGVPFNFLNGLDVDQETGDVYFIDSSTNHRRREFYLVVLTYDTSGRLMRYSPQSRRVTVLKGHLTYPNSLTMSHDNTHLLVSFTTLCQIHKYWIRGPKTGKFELFADLPGYPDNITRDEKGGYWVAISNLKPDDPAGAAPEHPVAFRLDQHGKIREALNGGIDTSISEVHERDGSLWIGSVINPYVGVYSGN